MVRRKRCHGCGRLPKKGAEWHEDMAKSFEEQKREPWKYDQDIWRATSGAEKRKIFARKYPNQPNPYANAPNDSLFDQPESVDSFEVPNQTGYNGSFVGYPAADANGTYFGNNSPVSSKPNKKTRRGGALDARDTPEFWAECEKQYGKAQASKMKRMYNKMKAPPKRERGPSVEAPLTPKPKVGKGTRKNNKRGRGVDDFDSEFDRVDPVNKALWRKQKKLKVNSGHYALNMHQ